MTQKTERPQALESETHRMETGYGKIYVEVTFKDGRPFEVFITKGQSGGFVNSWCEALAKALSNALRYGADAEELADDLIGIRTDNLAEDNGDTIYSIPDAVGVALKRSAEEKPAESVKDDDGDGAP